MTKPRPLTPGEKCPACSLRCGVAGTGDSPDLICAACGHLWVGSPAELGRAKASGASYEALEEAARRAAKGKREASELERKYRLAKEGKLWR